MIQGGRARDADLEDRPRREREVDGVELIFFFEFSQSVRDISRCRLAFCADHFEPMCMSKVF